tara:strand:- start:615 stop:749 length:135 start_codon:yes stop_codon:yes gene_type:complete
MEIISKAVQAHALGTYQPMKKSGSFIPVTNDIVIRLPSKEDERR